jgi:hypothetical protein
MFQAIAPVVNCHRLPQSSLSSIIIFYAHKRMSSGASNSTGMKRISLPGITKSG